MQYIYFILEFIYFFFLFFFVDYQLYIYIKLSLRNQISNSKESRNLLKIDLCFYFVEKVASAQRELSALMKPLKCDLCNAVVSLDYFIR